MWTVSFTTISSLISTFWVQELVGLYHRPNVAVLSTAHGWFTLEICSFPISAVPSQVKAPIPPHYFFLSAKRAISFLKENTVLVDKLHNTFFWGGKRGQDECKINFIAELCSILFFKIHAWKSSLLIIITTSAIIQCTSSKQVWKREKTDLCTSLTANHLWMVILKEAVTISKREIPGSWEHPVPMNPPI